MWPHFSPQCRKDVDRILRSGRLTAYRANAQWGVGPQKWSEAYGFEREVEAKFKVRHAVAVNSGTAALHSALAGLGVAGKEVVTSPFTFSATASAILLAGGRPVFADVDPHTFCITKETVNRAITKRTAAILPVHLFGYFQDLSGLEDLGIPIVEDACQAVGASRGGKFSGTVGSAGVYSFNGSKNIPAGEGGCIVTNSDKIAEKARLVVNHGENFGSTTAGFNYRMTELHACLARHGLRELESRNERRRELADELSQSLREYADPWEETEWDLDVELAYDFNEPKEEHAYYVFPLIYTGKSRAKFISRCAKRGLPVQESYTTPLHHLKAFRKYATRELPLVDELHSKTLCLITTLTPEKPISYAKWCAKVIREALE